MADKRLQFTGERGIISLIDQNRARCSPKPKAPRAATLGAFCMSVILQGGLLKAIPHNSACRIVGRCAPMMKRKAQGILCVFASIFSKSAVCKGRRDGTQVVKRELCGVAAKTLLGRCCLLSPVQPLADKMYNDVCQHGEHQIDQDRLHVAHLPLCQSRFRQQLQYSIFCRIWKDLSSNFLSQ
jgi:hypothetical protein